MEQFAIVNGYVLSAIFVGAHKTDRCDEAIMMNTHNIFFSFFV